MEMMVGGENTRSWIKCVMAPYIYPEDLDDTRNVYDTIKLDFAKLVDMENKTNKLTASNLYKDTELILDNPFLETIFIRKRVLVVRGLLELAKVTCYSTIHLLTIANADFN